MEIYDMDNNNTKNNIDNNIDTNNDTKNNIDNNIDTNNDTIYYVQQFKHKIFKPIPGKIRKNIQYLNIFTYNFKLPCSYWNKY
jgi:hypothetical protein